MVVKVYVSGISGNKEVKKRQQRVLMILDSKNIQYDVIDIAEPGREADKDFMQNNSKSNGGTVSDPNPRSALPPQVFNDDEYCGDYDQFDLANEVDTLELFLKVEVPPEEPVQAENEQDNAVNGDVDGEKKSDGSKENSQEKEITEDDKPAEKEGTPGKEGSPIKEKSQSKEGTPVNEGTPLKEGTPVKEESSTKEKSPSKEGTPVNENEKELSPEKEKTPVRQASTEKENSPAKGDNSQESEVGSKKSSKANSPEKEELNENGTVSSREQSEEKENTDDGQVVENKKSDNPSESLIENEKIASVE